MIKANGSHKFNCSGGRISDSPVTSKGRFGFEDCIVLTDMFTLSVNQRTGYKDYFPTSFRFNGTFKHDGKITASGSIEKLHVLVKGLDTVDKHKTRLKHNGSIKADGSHKFDGVTGLGEFLDVSSGYLFQESINTTDGQSKKITLRFLHDTVDIQEAPDIKVSFVMNDGIEIDEEFTVGLRHHHKHDGKYKANGKINFNSGILVSV